MKNHLSAATFLAAVIFSSAVLQAEPANFTAQLDQIRALLKPNESDSADAKKVKAMMEQYPANWQSLVDRDQLPRIAEYGPRIAGLDLSPVPDLASKIEAFSKSAKEESERREEAKIAAAEALLAQVGDQLKNARKAEDLDALMLTLNTNKISDYDNSPKLSALSRQLQGALQITANWQEYLIAEETGNAQQSRSSLQQVSSQLASTPVLPRSIVLRLLNPTAPIVDPKGTEPTQARTSVEAVMARLAESGDSAAATEELKSVPKTSLSGSDESNFPKYLQTVEDLRKLEPTMSESEAFTNIRMVLQQSQGRFFLTRAIDQIAINAIARSYGIANLSARNTSARKVLEGIVAEARQQQDWPKLRKVMISMENLNGATYGQEASKRTADFKIISLLELGKVAEERDDFEGAATAYLEASSIDGLYLQREVAYAKLADLKKNSPDQVAPVLAKAEESRQRAEAARYVADMEVRERLMRSREIPDDRPRSREEMSKLRLMVQEVVAEFLKEKRLEADKPIENDPKTKERPNKD